VIFYEYAQQGRVYLASSPGLDASVPVSEEWAKYKGTIKTKNPEAEVFLFALVVCGEVYIDDVVLNYSGKELL